MARGAGTTGGMGTMGGAGAMSGGNGIPGASGAPTATNGVTPATGGTSQPMTDLQKYRGIMGMIGPTIAAPFLRPVFGDAKVDQALNRAHAAAFPAQPTAQPAQATAPAAASSPTATAGAMPGMAPAQQYPGPGGDMAAQQPFNWGKFLASGIKGE